MADLGYFLNRIEYGFIWSFIYSCCGCKVGKAFILRDVLLLDLHTIIIFPTGVLGALGQCDMNNDSLAEVLFS